VETLFMAHGQLLSLILEQQHEKVASPWFRRKHLFVTIRNWKTLHLALVFISSAQ